MFGRNVLFNFPAEMVRVGSDLLCIHQFCKFTVFRGH